MFSPTFQSSFWIFAFVRVDKGFHYHFSHEGKVTNPSIWLVLFLSLPSRNSSTTSNHIKSFVSFRFAVRGIWRMIILAHFLNVKEIIGERWINSTKSCKVVGAELFFFPEITRIHLFFLESPGVWAFPPSDGRVFLLLLWNDIFATKGSHIVTFMNYSRSSSHEMFLSLRCGHEGKKGKT